MSKFIHYNIDSFQLFVNQLPDFGINGIALLQEFKPSPNADSLQMKINRSASFSWLNPPSFEVYLDHPAYNYYPLVNASYELAELFCKWRTAMVQLHYAKSATAKERQQFYKKIHYRLPTEDEWNFALQKFQKSNKLLRSKGASLYVKDKFAVTDMAEFVFGETKFANSENQSKPLPERTTFRCICTVEK